MLRDGETNWSVSDAREVYEIDRWGHGYFSVSDAGTVCVHPDRDPNKSIELLELVEKLGMRGLHTPILIRFNEILRDRLNEIADAFRIAREEHGYTAPYSCVYPIKVNQQRQVVEQILEHGRRHGFGIEAGSKPELMVVMALADNQTPIVCNGFKDREYIELALLAQKTGRHVIVVVEKFSDLRTIVAVAKELDIVPAIGIRVKLASRGSGRWKSSGGYRSKFGLTVTEILQGFEFLKQNGLEASLQLLHFHLGSQITNIRHIKTALTEATRVYVDLFRRGADLKYLDVGGGLGVDYDGSQTNFESSMNYTLQEYANDVVYHIQSVCCQSDIPCPHIISESGRAITAYHSVLVFDVLGVSSPLAATPPETLPEDSPTPIQTLFDTYTYITNRNLVESFHDAQQAFDMVATAFAAGFLSLDQRSAAEKLFWSICNRIRQYAADLDYVPDEIRGLDSLLASTYFCNFSLFQSMPDSWAINQLFPIMPIHRLNERPDQPGILGDITCDSDGKIDRFIDRRDISKTLLLHEPQGAYYLAVFLVGAYQEILGDLHNLFGDTNAIHVSMNADGTPTIASVVRGDTVKDVLRYVQFDPEDLLGRMETSVEEAVQSRALTHEEAGRFLKFYEDGLRGYTYLE